jgi:hypothetical protein
MFKIKRLYRENYAGEDVITKLTYTGGKWEEERDWVMSHVSNTRLSSQAIVVGGGSSWKEGEFKFDVSHIENHKGGIRGSNKLQVYGTNTVYQHLTPDFLVVDDDVAEKSIQDGATASTIVYAHAKKIVEFPGRFYLIPQDPPWNAGAIATYMACFDGHTKIYLMGFDGKAGEDAFYEQTMLELFTLYSDVEFIRITPTPGYYMPESWKYCANIRQIDYRGFVLEADLG